MLRLACLPALLASTLTAAEPVSPADSLKLFELHPEVRIELVAAEPQVIDPVAIAWDADGTLFVVEMSDYPHGPTDGGTPLSRIRRLIDADGDGFYEKATVFADGLLFANGLQPWQGGLVVTMAGEVAWMKDTDGDGKADVRETWFKGFKAENPQLRANHPTFAYDNHIYVANGLRGGVVIAEKEAWKQDAEPVNISGMDFRFDPLRGKYEAVSGMGQFGLTFDDFGNRFVCSNRNPCNHIVLENHYLKRNPFLGVSQVANVVSPAGADSRVYAIADAWTTSTLHAGQFTAACGITNYRGDLLPAEFRGNSFTCEPTGHLVHRDVLTPRGGTFTSKYGREKVEFLASKDTWFRPVNLTTGPDGALYLCDMYRAVIEHPQFMPTELKTRPDLRYGDDRGRIYRIVPKPQVKPSPHPTSLGKLTTAELVPMLEHTNSWQRETAARLIYERQDKSVVQQLIELRDKGKSPQSRIHAMWALKGLDAIDRHLAAPRRDEDPQVARHAIRLLEPWANEVRVMEEMARSALRHPHTQFQAALSIGSAKRDAEYAILARIAAMSDDEWTRAGVLSGLNDNLEEFLRVVLSSSIQVNAEFLADLSMMVGRRGKSQEINSLLLFMPSELGNWRTAEGQCKLSRVISIVSHLEKGLRTRRLSLGSAKINLSDAGQEIVGSLYRVVAARAVSERTPQPLRLQCLELLAYSAQNLVHNDIVVGLALRDSSLQVRRAALDLLARRGGKEIGEQLLKNYSAQSPTMRQGILTVLLSNTERTAMLLDAIGDKKIKTSELSAGQVRQLTSHRDAAIKKRAASLLAAAIPQDRKEVLAKYQKALSIKADPKRGREVFRKNCITCHRVGDLGVNVAPDIGDSRTAKPSILLTNILDPNRAVDNNYFSFTILTNDGISHGGIISAETATSVTLKQPEGKTVTLLRRDIRLMKSDGISLMPVGMEKNINVQQMADLISFIKNWRYLDGNVPIDVGSAKR